MNMTFADISLFENLQTAQHDRFGCSSLGVFNAVPKTTERLFNEPPPLDARSSLETNPADVYIRQLKECRALLEKYVSSPDKITAQRIEKERETLGQTAPKAQADIESRINDGEAKNISQRTGKAMSQLNQINELWQHVADLANNVGIPGFDVPNQLHPKNK